MPTPTPNSPKKRVVVTACHECGATAQDAFLERVKGTNLYLCDNCLSDGASVDSGYSDDENNDDSSNDSDSNDFGGGDFDDD